MYPKPASLSREYVQPTKSPQLKHTPLLSLRFSLMYGYKHNNADSLFLKVLIVNPLL